MHEKKKNVHLSKQLWRRRSRMAFARPKKLKKMYCNTATDVSTITKDKCALENFFLFSLLLFFATVYPLVLLGERESCHCCVPPFDFASSPPLPFCTKVVVEGRWRRALALFAAASCSASSSSVDGADIRPNFFFGALEPEVRVNWTRP